MTLLSDQLMKQIEFIIEIDKLKTIYRKTKLIYDDRHENDAEHTWHLAMMALVLHSHANENVDVLKVIKMLLVHDIVEIDAGDTFAYDAVGYEDKEEREKNAANRIFGLLPEEQTQALLSLWLEFEQRETAEAKFANALDRLQPILHNYKNEGDSWQKYGITASQVQERNKIIGEGSETLWALIQQIINESIEKGYLQK